MTNTKWTGLCLRTSMHRKSSLGIREFARYCVYRFPPLWFRSPAGPQVFVNASTHSLLGTYLSVKIDLKERKMREMREN